MPLSFLLFFVIIVEGYVVLASELLAIRQTTPYIGNGSDTVSIIIAAVLMPLAVGYYAGGRYRPGLINNAYSSVRKKLTRNIIISAFFLLPGLSYLTIELFFAGLLVNGVENRILLVTLYSVIFIVTPVFLLGQTVPLVSNYFSSQKLARITGKMLFCSTVGSFFGAVISTLILMNFIGVHNTVNVIFVLLTFIVFLISKKTAYQPVVVMAAITIVSFAINGDLYLKARNVVSNNAYNTISILENGDTRHLVMNNTFSSMLGKDGRKYPYVEFVEYHYIKPLLKDDIAPKNILVVGAAGFTFGLEDKKNRYVYVDIDKAVKDVAEKQFLEQRLSENKEFVSEDIRSYLTRTKEKFDLILLDAYLGGITIPEYLVTQNFFLQVRGALNENGVVAANFIVSPDFSGAFSQRLDNTLRSVFPHLSRQIVDPSFDGWTREDSRASNIIYTYTDVPHRDTTDIYTDDKNPMSFDKPKKNAIRLQ